jgi:hypothetical protein
MLLVYGEIISKILKKKPIKSIRIKAHLDISIMHPFGINFLTNKTKIISKKLMKTKSNLNFSKVHSDHLVKVSQKKISH